MFAHPSTIMTLSLRERVRRQRDGNFGHTPSSPAPEMLQTGDLKGLVEHTLPGPSSWWKAQNDSFSKLDGLCTDLGVSSPHRGRPRSPQVCMPLPTCLCVSSILFLV